MDAWVVVMMVVVVVVVVTATTMRLTIRLLRAAVSIRDRQTHRLLSKIERMPLSNYYLTDRS